MRYQRGKLTLCHERVVMKNISVGSVIILILCSCAFAFHHSCSVDGCRDGPGRLKCQSCNPGCHGQDCKHVCRGECDADGCDRTTGECFRCKPGLYGPRCSKRCPNECSIKNIDGEAYCDRHTGSCLEHCERGKTGLYCDDNCPADCTNSVCAKSGGKCLLGCKYGWSGAHCNIPCDNCLHEKCTSNGYCIIHCKFGFYGHRCDKACPHCYITGCDRQSGICEQCYPGRHGRHCDNECPAKCYRSRDGYKHCNRDNGRCLEGCQSGYHGSYCKTACSSNCKQNECHSKDGHCIHPCELGRYGSHCNSKCENCKSGCNRHSGICIDGCKHRYHGDRCDKECTYCADCDQKTGQCITCPVGHCGDSCTKLCNINCKHNECNINGTCINGCKGSFHGYLCDNKCNPNCQTCNQFSGKCVSCMQNYGLENGDCRPKASYLEANSVSSQAFHFASESAPFYILLPAALLSRFVSYE